MYMYLNVVSLIFSQTDDEELDELGVEDDVFDIDNEDDTEDISSILPEGPGIPKLTTVTAETMKEEKYIISKGRLDALLEMAPIKTCGRCGKEIQRAVTKNGSVVICKWVRLYCYFIFDCINL